jgi:hypothetical protein
MAGRVAAVMLGLVAAVAVLFLGPKETIVCESAGWPNSMFGDMFGHVDGSSFTGCEVPTGGAWAFAGALAIASPAALVGESLATRRRGRSREP